MGNCCKIDASKVVYVSGATQSYATALAQLANNFDIEDSTAISQIIREHTDEFTESKVMKIEYIATARKMQAKIMFVRGECVDHLMAAQWQQKLFRLRVWFEWKDYAEKPFDEEPTMSL